MVRVQLTQEKVQKSMSTTLPRSSARVSGGLLIQRTIPVKSGTCSRPEEGASDVAASPGEPPPGSAEGWATATPTVSATTTARTAPSAQR